MAQAQMNKSIPLKTTSAGPLYGYGPTTGTTAGINKDFCTEKRVGHAGRGALRHRVYIPNYSTMANFHYSDEFIALLDSGRVGIDKESTLDDENFEQTCIPLLYWIQHTNILNEYPVQFKIFMNFNKYNLINMVVNGYTNNSPIYQGQPQLILGIPPYIRNLAIGGGVSHSPIGLAIPNKESLDWGSYGTYNKQELLTMYRNGRLKVSPDIDKMIIKLGVKDIIHWKNENYSYALMEQNMGDINKKLKILELTELLNLVIYKETGNGIPENELTNLKKTSELASLIDEDYYNPNYNREESLKSFKQSFNQSAETLQLYVSYLRL